MKIFLILDIHRWNSQYAAHWSIVYIIPFRITTLQWVSILFTTPDKFNTFCNNSPHWKLITTTEFPTFPKKIIKLANFNNDEKRMQRQHNHIIFIYIIRTRKNVCFALCPVFRTTTEIFQPPTFLQKKKKNYNKISYGNFNGILVLLR